MAHDLMNNHPDVQSSTCRHCGDPITRGTVGDWLHKPTRPGNSATIHCRTNTAAQPVDTDVLYDFGFRAALAHVADDLINYCDPDDDPDTAAVLNDYRERVLAMRAARDAPSVGPRAEAGRVMNGVVSAQEAAVGSLRDRLEHVDWDVRPSDLDFQRLETTLGDFAGPVCSNPEQHAAHVAAALLAAGLPWKVGE